MSAIPGRRLLSLGYLLAYNAFAAGVVLVGFTLDRAPLLPPAVTERYQRSMLSLLATLARPGDALSDQSSEPTAGAPREPTP